MELFSGKIFRTNVVADFERVESSEVCHQHCEEKKNKGCKYYVWENVTKECVLYKDMDKIEYDKDPDEKCTGSLDGCLGVVTNYVATCSSKYKK